MDKDKRDFTDMEEMLAFAASQGPLALKKAKVVVAAHNTLFEALSEGMRKAQQQSEGSYDAAVMGALEASMQFTGKLIGIIAGMGLDMTLDELLERTAEGLRSYATEAATVTKKIKADAEYAHGAPKRKAPRFTSADK